jgi:hypothetical protein
MRVFPFDLAGFVVQALALGDEYGIDGLRE